MTEIEEMEEYEPPVRARPLTAKQIEEARKVLAVQRSTIPSDGDIGPAGAIRRAVPLDAMGHPILKPLLLREES